MEQAFKQLVLHQFEAALCTLSHCVEQCPDAIWKQPVAKYPFCQVAFHVLFFTDYYLEKNESTFRDQRFHQQNRDLFADYEQLEYREPTSLYEKSQIRKYLEFCRSKVARVIESETTDSLVEKCDFPRRNFSRAELYIYHLRHIQHHTAQLILRLRLDSEVDIPWVESGWDN